jgi:hypothetical protein
VRHTNRPVLILTPLAVGPQTVRESNKFGFDSEQSRNGMFKKKIVVTNYERLHYFKPGDFSGVVADESSCIKDFKSKTKSAVTEFMRTIPYRLLCTATAAPNDYPELGTSSEALGYLGYQDMITKFFRNETKNDKKSNVGWARQMKWVLRKYAERDFWRWICSWARACRKPSDMGFDDGKFILPELRINEHSIKSKTSRSGFLFDIPAETLKDQQEERRRTIPERCEEAARLVANHPGHSLVWCSLNHEGDMLERMIPGSVQVSGSDAEEKKEEAIRWFTGINVVDSEKRVLISKPEIFGYGLNLQCSSHQVFFISHSYERFYQAIRRSWRFGQENPVDVDIVMTESEVAVLSSIRRKSDQADAMFTRLVEFMNDQLHIVRENPFTVDEEVPSWL